MGIRKLVGAIGRWLRGGKPKPPKIIGGHRGIAAQNLKKPQLDRYGERLASGHEKIGEDEATQFLAGDIPVYVMSSNVAMVQYHPKDEKLMVEYLAKGRHPASGYLYSNVSEAEAISFITAHSKGGWCWDHLRVRGSATAHKKPYVKIF